LNGIRTKEKLTYFRSSINLIAPAPDVIVLTETNLCCDINDSELGLANFDIYRRDRYNYFSPLSGGGVLIAVSKKLKSSLLLKDSECEQIFLKVISQNKSLILGVVYIPPSSENDIYQHHVSIVDDLKSKHDKCDLLLLGDYNLPKVEWSNCDSFSESLNANCFHQSNLIAANVDTILTGFSFLDLKQYFPINVKKGYTLDLAFSNLDESQIKNHITVDSLSKIEFHHDPVMFNVNLVDYYQYLPQDKENKNFYKADYISIGMKLSDINWEKYLDTNNLEQKVDKF